MTKPKTVTAVRNGCEILVDDCDAHLLDSGYVNAVTKKTKNGLVYHRVSYKPKDGKGSQSFLARKIMGLEKGDKRVVDHINRDGLDNRRVNLRVCTISQNSMNKEKISMGTYSKYKGVSFDKRQNRWIAVICVEQRSKIAGYFKTENAAARCYNSWAKTIFGEYAYLNEISKNNKTK